MYLSKCNPTDWGWLRMVLWCQDWWSVRGRPPVRKNSWCGWAGKGGWTGGGLDVPWRTALTGGADASAPLWRSSFKGAGHQRQINGQEITCTKEPVFLSPLGQLSVLLFSCSCCSVSPDARSSLDTIPWTSTPTAAAKSRPRRWLTSCCCCVSRSFGSVAVCGCGANINIFMTLTAHKVQKYRKT